MATLKVPVPVGALPVVTAPALDDYIILDSPTEKTRRMLFTIASGVATDHGSLTGLSDDDHPLYFNQARGDARYALLTDLSTDHGLLTGLTDDDHPQYFDLVRGDARYAQVVDLGSYLLEVDAATTYLTISDASTTYLSQSAASATYLTQVNAAATYLTLATASSTYALLTDARFHTHSNQTALDKITENAGLPLWNGSAWPGGGGGGVNYDDLHVSWDGQGAVLATGSNIFRSIERACTITSASLVADVSSSVTVTVRRYTPSAGSLGSPTTLGQMTLGSAVQSRSTILAGWTKTVSEGDVLEFVLDPTPIGAKWLVMSLGRTVAA